MLFCDVFRKAVQPFSGSGRLISGEYDNSTKPCAVQAILESLMSPDGRRSEVRPGTILAPFQTSDGAHQHASCILTKWNLPSPIYQQRLKKQRGIAVSELKSLSSYKCGRTICFRYQGRTAKMPLP